MYQLGNCKHGSNYAKARPASLHSNSFRANHIDHHIQRASEDKTVRELQVANINGPGLVSDVVFRRGSVLLMLA